MLEKVVRFALPYDLGATLGVLQRGLGDPSIRVDSSVLGHAGGQAVALSGASAGDAAGGAASRGAAGAWTCFRIYDEQWPHEVGSVTVRFDQVSAREVRVRVLGSNTVAEERGISRAESFLGTGDDWREFEFLLDALEDEGSLWLAQVRRRHPAFRFPATGQLFDQLVAVTFEQKVTHDQARYGWRNLLRSAGEAAPSSTELTPPPWLRLPLTAEQIKAVPSWQWHKFWVQPPLSKTIQRIAHHASSIHRLAVSSLDTSVPDAESLQELAERLQSIPGVGPWTAAEVLQRSHGATDQVSVGDYHLAHRVGEALTGKRTDDPGMLRLLEPYRGHRHRVVRLIEASGFNHQKYGPKLTPEDHRGR